MVFGPEVSVRWKQFLLTALIQNKRALIQIIRLTSGQLCPALLLLGAGYCCYLFGNGRVFISVLIYINKYNKKNNM